MYIVYDIVYVIVYDIVYDIIYDIAVLPEQVLRVFIPKTMADDVEGIAASCLGSQDSAFGRFKSRILIWSSVMCFPSWFFTYISKK